MPPTLLLADRSLTIRRVIELTFADEDIRVVAVADGREAIERITAEPPDIVLADVGMPERDGYEVAAFVKTAAHLAHIPVLLLTGASEPIDEARARTVACDGVLVKPFEPQLLIARVRDLLAMRSGAAPTVSGASDGDYLDRLDAAFAAAMSGSARAIGAPLPASPEHESEGPGAALPQEAAPIRPVATAAPSAPPSLSDAFSALLAAERGARLPSGTGLPTVVLSDAAIDDIARRVIARLGDDSMRRAVLDAAERLVQAEIDRIKAAQSRTGGTG